MKLPEPNRRERMVKCPWCGAFDEDSWEYMTGDYECSSCEKPIRVEKETVVTYSTFARKETDHAD